MIFFEGGIFPWQYGHCPVSKTNIVLLPQVGQNFAVISEGAVFLLIAAEFPGSLSA